ncbi:MAG: hypothetical protein ACREXK_07015 [Gammaproteobacteria bacterium]
MLTEVELGSRTPGEVEIEAGLTKGEVVVTESQTTRDGAAIVSGAGRDRGARLAPMVLSDLSIRRPMLATVMSLMPVPLSVMPASAFPCATPLSSSVVRS